jgi:hypothetical protein
MDLFPVSMPIDHFMFAAGKSAPEAKKGMRALETNMKDIGLDRSYIHMGENFVPAGGITRRTLGISVTNDVLTKFGFTPMRSTSRAHAATIQPRQRAALADMLKHEGIKIKDSNMISNLLVFNPSEVAANSQTRTLKTGLHEIGHGVDNLTNSVKSQGFHEFYNVLDSLSQLANDSQGAETPFGITKDVADEFQNKFLKTMSEHGLSEAKAESFSGLISKTKIGQSSIDLILNGAASTEDIERTFLSGYHQLDDEFIPFGNYSKHYLDDARKSPAYNALAAHLDFGHLEELGSIEAHGTFMGTVNYR